MNRGLAVRGAVDLVIAVGVGVLIVWLFDVAGQSDSMPPVCTNRFGATIDCGQHDWVGIVAWSAVGVVLLSLWSFHAWRARAA